MLVFELLAIWREQVARVRGTGNAKRLAGLAQGLAVVGGRVLVCESVQECDTSHTCDHHAQTALISPVNAGSGGKRADLL